MGSLQFSFQGGSMESIQGGCGVPYHAQHYLCNGKTIICDDCSRPVRTAMEGYYFCKQCDTISCMSCTINKHCRQGSTSNSEPASSSRSNPLSALQAISDDDDDDELEEIEEPILPCAGSYTHKLEFLRKSPAAYYGNSFGCNMCGEAGYGEVYHCDSCLFDAHTQCAEVDVEIKVFYHKHTLQRYFRGDNEGDDENFKCQCCQRYVGEDVSAWAYKCLQCEDFAVHARCAKYAKSLSHENHPHKLKLVHKSSRFEGQCRCDACAGEICHTYFYTCTKGGCNFDLHPLCAVLPSTPLCRIFPIHRVNIDYFTPADELCILCESPSNGAWLYRCFVCQVSMHVDCFSAKTDGGGICASRNFPLRLRGKDGSGQGDPGRTVPLSDLHPFPPSRLRRAYPFPDAGSPCPDPSLRRLEGRGSRMVHSTPDGDSRDEEEEETDFCELHLHQTFIVSSDDSDNEDNSELVDSYKSSSEAAAALSLARYKSVKLRVQPKISLTRSGTHISDREIENKTLGYCTPPRLFDGSLPPNFPEDNLQSTYSPGSDISSTRSSESDAGDAEEEERRKVERAAKERRQREKAAEKEQEKQEKEARRVHKETLRVERAQQDSKVLAQLEHVSKQLQKIQLAGGNDTAVAQLKTLTENLQAQFARQHEVEDRRNEERHLETNALDQLEHIRRELQRIKLSGGNDTAVAELRDLTRNWLAQFATEHEEEVQRSEERHREQISRNEERYLEQNRRNEELHLETKALAQLQHVTIVELQKIKLSGGNDTELKAFIGNLQAQFERQYKEEVKRSKDHLEQNRRSEEQHLETMKLQHERHLEQTKLQLKQLDLLKKQAKDQDKRHVEHTNLLRQQKQEYLNGLQEIIRTQVQSTTRVVPRLVLCTETKKKIKKVLTSLRVGIKGVHLHLFCEHAQQPHLVAGAPGCEINQKVAGDRWTKLQPFFVAGLKVLMMAVNLGISIGVPGGGIIKDVLPNLSDIAQNVVVLDLGEHGLDTNGRASFPNPEEEEAAAQWLVCYLRDQKVNIGDCFKLHRVRYKAPDDMNGNVGWLCSEHVEAGRKKGSLDHFPVF